MTKPGVYTSLRFCFALSGVDEAISRFINSYGARQPTAHRSQNAKALNLAAGGTSAPPANNERQLTNKLGLTTQFRHRGIDALVASVAVREHENDRWKGRCYKENKRKQNIR